MGVKPRLTKADVMKARQAFHAIADIPEWERIAAATFGDDAIAPATAAGPAAKIAAIWSNMTPAERDEFNRVLSAQVGEIPDTLAIDVGAAAQMIVENAMGQEGRPDEFPGLHEAVRVLYRSWEDQGGKVQVGRLYTTDGPSYRGEPPMRPTPTVRFVAAGILRAIPEEYRMMDWTQARRRLLHECWTQVKRIRYPKSR